MNELNLANPNFLARFRIKIIRDSNIIHIRMADLQEIIWRGKPIKMNRRGNLDDELQIWNVPFLTETYHAKTFQDLTFIKEKEFNDESA